VNKAKAKARARAKANTGVLRLRPLGFAQDDGIPYQVYQDDGILYQVYRDDGILKSKAPERVRGFGWVFLVYSLFTIHY
jgi:hypothetical protein